MKNPKLTQMLAEIVPGRKPYSQRGVGGNPGRDRDHDPSPSSELHLVGKRLPELVPEGAESFSGPALG